MTAATEDKIRGAALERFGKKLKDIYFFEQRARTVSAELDDEALAAQQSLNDADYELNLAKELAARGSPNDGEYELELPDGSPPKSLAELQIDVDIALNHYDRVHDKPEVWRREVGRFTAINLCIAFENFHCNFLAEQLLLEPAKLSEYAKDKPWATSADPLTMDYVAGQFKGAFHGFNNNVKAEYQKITGKTPQLYEEQEALGQEDWTAARQDVSLLFEIRHRLIHSDGHAGPKYQEKVQSYRDRLNIEIRDKPAIPGPDDLLRSPAVVSSEGKRKLDDFLDSLQKYARYITNVCDS